MQIAIESASKWLINVLLNVYNCYVADLILYILLSSVN